MSRPGAYRRCIERQHQGLGLSGAGSSTEPVECLADRLAERLQRAFIDRLARLVTPLVLVVVEIDPEGSCRACALADVRGAATGGALQAASSAIRLQRVGGSHRSFRVRSRARPCRRGRAAASRAPPLGGAGGRRARPDRLRPARSSAASRGRARRRRSSACRRRRRLRERAGVRPSAAFPGSSGCWPSLRPWDREPGFERTARPVRARGHSPPARARSAA